MDGEPVSAVISIKCQALGHLKRHGREGPHQTARGRSKKTGSDGKGLSADGTRARRVGVWKNGTRERRDLYARDPAQWGWGLVKLSVKVVRPPA